MAETLYVRRNALNRLEPLDARSEEAMRALPAGRMLKAVVSQGRNIAHHRKLFALLKLVLDNQDYFQSTDELLYALKMRLGYAVPVRIKGQVGYMPRSISFSAMGQQEFEDFYNRALDFIAAEVIPGIDCETLRQEVEEFLQ